jgi:hypothetical protein
MDKDLLQKHQNDPAWAEVIRLYSGLFDTQDEREDFILDLADKDILLAAECKTSSVEEEDSVLQSIKKKCQKGGFNELVALLTISETEEFNKLFRVDKVNIAFKKFQQGLLELDKKNLINLLIQGKKLHTLKRAFNLIIKENSIFYTNELKEIYNIVYKRKDKKTVRLANRVKKILLFQNINPNNFS